jgi:CRISPR-associated protein Cas2
MEAFWVIAYDIANNRRRARVDKVLKGYALRVQESVFEGWLSHTRLSQLKRELRVEIETEDDHIRFYGLCHWCEGAIRSQGRGRRADDVDYYIF